MPRQICKYGRSCYRKNPDHFKEFSHPWLENVINDDGQSLQMMTDELAVDGLYKDAKSFPANQPKMEPVTTELSVNQNEIGVDDETKGEPVDENNELIQEPEDKPEIKAQVISQNDDVGVITPKKKPLRICKDDILEIVYDSVKMNDSNVTDSPVNKRKRLSSSSTTSPSKSPKSFRKPDNLLNLFLIKVKGMDQSVNNFCSIGITEILSRQWGQLQESVQFNYMFDVGWLIDQYPPCFRHLPILLVHQDKRETTAQLEAETGPYGNISLARARLNDAFGTHHTKMMILRYDNHLRVVIHTANLIEQDWREKTQGVWLSPLFPPFKDGEIPTDKSRTKFQTDLILYLRSYKNKAIDHWCEILKKYDMSEAKVYLIGSTPGRHTGADLHKYGHMKLRKILSSEKALCEQVQPNWPVIGQFSSIGSLGSKAEAWLQGEFLQSLGTTPNRFSAFSKPPMKLVFPCVDDVRNSLEGYPAGGSLPYSDSTHRKQLYLTKFLHRWKSDEKGRTRASPHIKSYFRVSPDMKQLYFGILTSANLSKAAWGSLEKQSSQLCIRAYELGVLFLPKSFGSFDTFSVSEGLTVDGDGEKVPITFPIPFDLPLTKYREEDEPWRWDIPQKSKPDSHGNIWIPSL